MIHKDSNEAEIKRGDLVQLLNAGRFDCGRNAIIIDFKSRDTAVISTDDDPAALQSESTFLLLKLKGVSLRDDFQHEIDYLSNCLLEKDEKIAELLNTLLVFSDLSKMAYALKRAADILKDKLEDQPPTTKVPS